MLNPLLLTMLAMTHFTPTLLATVPAALPVNIEREREIRDAVEHYFVAIEKRSSANMRRAFHPSALMFWLDQNGVLQSLSQYAWRIKLAQSEPDRSVRSVVDAIDATTNCAVVRVSAIRRNVQYVDYLLLLRLHSQWRIASKIFGPAKTQDQTAESNDQEIRRVVEKKLASDRTWDGKLLSTALHERAPIVSVDDDDIVITSLAEWQARYAQRREQKLELGGNDKIQHVEVRQDVGYAKWLMTTASGDHWQDYALVIKIAGEWKIITLAFTKE
jgi:Putative lumazine-binding